MPSDELRQVPCYSCGAMMIWLRTINGARIPLDAEPTADGNAVIRDGVVRFVSQTFQPDPGERRYKSHFATCPYANQHRRK